MSLALSMALGFQASASADFEAEAAKSVVDAVVRSIYEAGAPNVPGWVVGDTANYTVKGGIINGKMDSVVREEVAEGMWVQQDMDMGFLGKQKVETLYAPNGEVLEMLVNGEKQTPPSADDQEIIETKQDRITVKKGTFDCLYAKIKDKKSGDITEAWLNMQAVPISGLIKALAPSQMGKITVELVDFKKL